MWQSGSVSPRTLLGGSIIAAALGIGAIFVGLVQMWIGSHISSPGGSTPVTYGGGDFAHDFAHRGQKPPFFTLFHPILCIRHLSDKSSIYSYLRKRRFGLKIPRYLVPWGFDPPFGTNRINNLHTHCLLSMD
jgi:hypothetical protein